jgi:hypothetical protein
MPIITRYTIIINVLFFLFISSTGQPVEHHGQAAGWATLNYYDGTGFQTGVRYIPQLLLDIPVNKGFRIDGEISLDSYFSYTRMAGTSSETMLKASLYRTWLRFSGSRFEIRAGLQKINFGSALMLRPLMWFDRIDPRDPLQLTKGVYGLLGKYYFKNNANIWLWGLYGNKETKGWESIPSRPDRPELGGRFQLPVPRGEIALTYHNRVGKFPDDWDPPHTGSQYFPEDRIALDTKVDLGAGLWFEAALVHQQHPDLEPYTRSISFGANYTLGIGDGLNISAEQLVFKSSEEPFTGGEGISFTGFSASLPVSIITGTSVIIFYDWKNNGWYRFANLSFTFDKLAINIIGFWNAQSFGIFNYESGPNMYSGAGGQVMLVYNY